MNDMNDHSRINLIWKNKNVIMKNIEEKFEQDDYLNLDKLKSAFNSSIINNYYNYLSRILKNSNELKDMPKTNQ